MAFDMKADGLKEAIQHHEEEIFSKILENDDYPQLNRIWEQFYDGPQIFPDQANELVHELIALKEEKICEEEKHMNYTIDRLISFFSKSYRLKKQIYCISD
ncbi:MAG: hypothetical protein AAF065_13880 [Verrucomicrobiota bacterium]